MTEHLIAEMQSKLARHESRLTLHTDTFTNLIEVVGGLRKRIEQLEAQANPDLANALIKGIRHDAGLVWKTERRVRIDECWILRNQMNREATNHREAVLVVEKRIRELEAEEV